MGPRDPLSTWRRGHPRARRPVQHEHLSPTAKGQYSESWIYGALRIVTSWAFPRTTSRRRWIATVSCSAADVRPAARFVHRWREALPYYRPAARVGAGARLRPAEGRLPGGELRGGHRPADAARAGRCGCDAGYARWRKSRVSLRAHQPDVGLVLGAQEHNLPVVARDPELAVVRLAGPAHRQQLRRSSAARVRETKGALVEVDQPTAVRQQMRDSSAGGDALVAPRLDVVQAGRRRSCRREEAPYPRGVCRRRTSSPRGRRFHRAAAGAPGRCVRRRAFRGRVSGTSRCRGAAIQPAVWRPLRVPQAPGLGSSEQLEVAAVGP